MLIHKTWEKIGLIDFVITAFFFHSIKKCLIFSQVFWILDIASDIETPETVVPQNDIERDQQPSPRPTLPPFDTFLNPMNHP